MNQIKENAEEARAVKAFRVKMAMARINARPTKKSALSEAQMQDSSGYLTGEFDISSLPLAVKKHIITAGIIQGDIFQYGDGFAYVKEVNPSQAKSSSNKTLHLQVQALTPRSYEMAIGIIETLIDEVWDPQKKTLKRPTGYRSWGSVMKNEYEIQNLVKPVLSHLITKGIIKGEIYQYSGAVVNAKGSPYLADDSPQESVSERPIYLLIQGPDEKTLYWAIESIKNLIKEAEEIVNNDIPEIIFEKRAQPSEDPVSHDLEPEVSQHPQHLPFMPQLGQTFEADVKRCTVLVQWLLAHPLMVSFMACPPKGCESKQISKKMSAFALLCLPLYDQYHCSHLMPNDICANCHKFLSEAQKAIEQCFEAVVNFGYDISKLISVDDYIKDPAVAPEEIGVLYDYPLPLKLFYIDNCRLFIDLAINCGLEIEVSHIKSYLRSTNQWYPIRSLQNILADSKVNPCPSKNPKTHQYPLYCSIDHHGGLINFHLGTIVNASPEQLFRPDAPKIPRCLYFPFLNKLSVFSKLYNFNKYTSAPEKQTDEISGSISFAAYQMTKELLNNSEPNRFLPHGSLEGRSSQQQLHPGIMSGSIVAPPTRPEPPKPPARTSRFSVVPPQAPEPTSTFQPSLNNPSWNSQILQGNPQSPYGYFPSGGLKHHLQASTSQNAFPNLQNLPKGLMPNKNNNSKNEEQPQETQNLPPSFSTMREPKEKPTPIPTPKSDSSSKPSRKLRKEKKKEEAEKKKEMKREEISKTIETLKEKHGTDSFWTIDTSELKAGNAKEKLVNLLGTQENAYNLQFGSSQPQTHATSLLTTGSMFPQNLQQVLDNMQLSMPATQQTLFGAQPLMLMGHDDKSILEPARINTEQILKGQQLGQDDSQLLQDGSQPNPFSEVISKLQEYIHTTGRKTADGVESGDPPTVSVDEEASASPQLSSDTVLQSRLSVSSMQQDTSSIEQSTASADSAQDSPLSAIIQQLQQYIDSNSQITSQDDFVRKTPPADLFKNPIEPITKVTQQVHLVGPKHKQKSSQSESASTERTSESTKPKRVYIEFSNTKPTTPTTSFTHQSEYPVQKPYAKEESTRHKPSSSGQKNVGKQSEITSAFIDLTTSPDDLQKKTPPADVFKKPFGPIASKKTKVMQETSKIGLKRKQESSQLKSAFAERTCESTQPKRPYIEFSSTKPTTPTTSFTRHLESPVRKPGYGKEVSASQQPSSSVQTNSGKQPTVISEVSILGDSLLQGARALFGGSDNQDRRKDDFTIADLKKDVIQFHNKGGHLRPYCLLMCGVNDIINLTSPKRFVQELKNLLNYLLTKEYYILLVTLPLVISNRAEINKAIPEINGLILSFHTKSNLSIIPFHKLFQGNDDPKNFLKSIQIVGKDFQCHTVVLTDLACKLIRDQIENEVDKRITHQAYCISKVLFI